MDFFIFHYLNCEKLVLSGHFESDPVLSGLFCHIMLLHVCFLFGLG